MFPWILIQLLYVYVKKSTKKINTISNKIVMNLFLETFIFKIIYFFFFKKACFVCLFFKLANKINFQNDDKSKN